MLLFFLIALIFVLHIQFLIRNLVFDTYDINFFQFTQSYMFDRTIATESLLFVSFCTLAFALGYRYTYKRRILNNLGTADHGQSLDNISKLYSIFGLSQAAANLILSAISGFQYQAIAETLESSAFIFELRIIFLICFAFIVLNIPPKTLWRDPAYRTFRIIFFIYTVSIIILQSRSRIFELFSIPLFAYLMWNGDKIKWRYISVLLLALVIPNIIVLGRLGLPGSFGDLLSGLFSVEYSVVLNNFLGGAIEGRYSVHEPLTFLKSLWLIIPSPIRNLLGIEVIKSDAYDALVRIADVRNGGYSMMAEMFQNFGWFSIPVFGGMGYAIGSLNRRAAAVGSVPIIAAAAPLIYAAFFVTLRNDFGVFLKFTVQAFVIAYLLRMTIAAQRPMPAPPTGAAGDHHAPHATSHP